MLNNYQSTGSNISIELKYRRHDRHDIILRTYQQKIFIPRQCMFNAMSEFILAILAFFKKIMNLMPKNKKMHPTTDVSIKIQGNNNKMSIICVKPESDYCRIEKCNDLCKLEKNLESDYCRIKSSKNDNSRILVENINHRTNFSDTQELKMGDGN